MTKQSHARTKKDFSDLEDSPSDSRRNRDQPIRTPMRTCQLSSDITLIIGRSAIVSAAIEAVTEERRRKLAQLFGSTR